MKHMQPVITWCLICAVALTAAVALVCGRNPARAGAKEAAQAEPPVSPGAAVHLPIVLRNWRPGIRCPADSPFSIAVPALHQITAGGSASAGDGFASLLAALQASGACWARVRVSWADIQPEAPPAPYRWAWHDEKLRLLAETGLRLIVHVDVVPPWAGRSEWGPIDVDRLDAFAQFLADLARRYQQPPYEIHHWELFNEPDRVLSSSQLGWGSNGDQYAAMLEVAYPAIKAADPGATVLMGGLAYDNFSEASPSGAFYRYFPDMVVTSPGGQYLDLLNLHYFPAFHTEWERWDPSSPERQSGQLPAPTCGLVADGVGTAYDAGGPDVMAKIGHFRNRLATCYGMQKPLWITELGQHGVPGSPDSLAQQARYVIQGHARALTAGALNVTWYALVSPPYEQDHFGLLNQDGWSPKPAFRTYQMVTAELADYRYAATLKVAGAEAYAFENSAQQIKIVAWSRDAAVPASLVIAPAGRVRVIDREATVTHVDDGGEGDQDGMSDGSVTLQVSEEPVLVSP